MHQFDIAVAALPASAIDSPQWGITVPSLDAFASLAELVTFEPSTTHDVLTPLSDNLFEFDNNVAKKLLSLSHDELLDLGAAWAQSWPWKSLDVNGMDLAGFLLELSAIWKQVDEPKRVYLYRSGP